MKRSTTRSTARDLFKVFQLKLGVNMRCQRDEFTAGAIFHIYNYSLAELNLFREHEDYSYYLSKLTSHLRDDCIKVYSYCLLPDQFHFVIRQDTEYQGYKLFNKINTSYAHYFNSKTGRKGKLFAGKLQHKLVKTDSQLISLCHYIHFYPVKVGLVKDLSRWPYSSYLEYARLRKEFLYSKELSLDHPEVFNNYGESLEKYVNRLDERYLLYK